MAQVAEQPNDPSSTPPIIFFCLSVHNVAKKAKKMDRGELERGTRKTPWPLKPKYGHVSEEPGRGCCCTVQW